MKQKRLLVIGLGNDILTDDGIGVRLIKDLTGMFENPLIEFKTACCGGLELMELILGFDRIILIDAIRTAGGKPGEVYYFNVSDFMETSNISSLHDVDFITSLRLGKTLDIDLTENILFIAVEIEEDLVFSEEFTPELKKRYPEILETVSGLIREVV